MCDHIIALWLFNPFSIFMRWIIAKCISSRIFECALFSNVYQMNESNKKKNTSNVCALNMKPSGKSKRHILHKYPPIYTCSRRLFVGGGGCVVVVIEALSSRRKPKIPYMDLLLLMRDISQILHKVDSVTQHIKFDMRYFYVVWCAHFTSAHTLFLSLRLFHCQITITTTISIFHSMFSSRSWFDCFKQQCCRMTTRERAGFALA